MFRSDIAQIYKRATALLFKQIKQLKFRITHKGGLQRGLNPTISLSRFMYDVLHIHHSQLLTIQTFFGERGVQIFLVLEAVTCVC